MRLLSIVVTYYPDIQDAKNNILQYINYVDKLIIWENTPIQERGKYEIELSDYSDKIVYDGTDKNEGIAYPLNRAIEYGKANGYTHLLTMDQDSYWINFFDFVTEINHTAFDNIAAFCPPIEGIYENKSGINIPIIMNECITSGTIYNINVCGVIGMFREDYVIDAVDLEYLYRSQNKGYNTIMLPIGLLKHQLGNSCKICNRWISSNYSAYRTYHIVRNHIMLWRTYPQYFQKKEFLLRETVYRMFYIILGEESKFSKLFAILRAIVVGLISKK